MFLLFTHWLVSQILNLPRSPQALAMSPHPISARNQARIARKKRTH